MSDITVHAAEHGNGVCDRFTCVVHCCPNCSCPHTKRREIAPKETEVKDNRLLEKRSWWCPDCDEKWTTSKKLGDVGSMEIRIDLT